MAPVDAGAPADLAHVVPPSHGDMMMCSSLLQDRQGCSCSSDQPVACYTGDPRTRSLGACKDGTQACSGGEFGTYGACVGSKIPSAEAGACADGLDNDCNGMTDCDDASCATDTACITTNGCTKGTSPDSAYRCGGGTHMDPFTGCCVACTANDCDYSPECCLAPVCATATSCQMCLGGKPQLDPACKGRVDADCDDYPEDCDQLCCPCRPANQCMPCPLGQVDCGSGCIDVASDPQHCGACDVTCSGSCVSASCV